MRSSTYTVTVRRLFPDRLKTHGSVSFLVNPRLMKVCESSSYQSTADSMHPYRALLSSAMINPSLRTKGSMLLSTSTNNVAISGSILINTSLSGSWFGILAFRLAHPTSAVTHMQLGKSCILVIKDR